MVPIIENTNPIIAAALKVLDLIPIQDNIMPGIQIKIIINLSQNKTILKIPNTKPKMAQIINPTLSFFAGFCWKWVIFFNFFYFLYIFWSV